MPQIVGVAKLLYFHASSTSAKMNDSSCLSAHAERVDTEKPTPGPPELVASEVGGAGVGGCGQELEEEEEEEMWILAHKKYREFQDACGELLDPGACVGSSLVETSLISLHADLTCIL